MEDRSWMYQRKNSVGYGMNPDFVAGVYKFLEFSTTHCNPADNGEIRCPCSSCKNRKFIHKDIIISHLYRKGFVPGYTNWSCHGEPSILLYPTTQKDVHTMQKERPNKSQFIDQQAKKTCENFDKLLQQPSQILSSSSCNVDEKIISLETTEDMKKEQVYKLGFENKRIKVAADISSSPSQSSQVETEMIENLKKQIVDLKQKLATQDEQILNLMRGQEKIFKLLEEKQGLDSPK